MTSQIQQQYLQNMKDLEIIIKNYKKDINKYIEKIEELEKQIFNKNNIILNLNDEIKKKTDIIDISNIYDYNILIKNPCFKSLSEVNSGLVSEIKCLKQKNMSSNNTEMEDLIVDYNLSIYNKEVNDDYYQNQIYDSIYNINLENGLTFKNQTNYYKVTLNNAFYDRFFKEFITNKKKKSITSKKSNPKKLNILKNNDIVFDKTKKVTLNNCLYIRFKKEYDNKMELLKINAKNKLLFYVKKISKKIIIAKRFIKELTIKKDFNLQIKNLFNKIKNNINNKICIKFNNPKNEIEKLFSINIISKYNEIESQSKLGGLFIKENIHNKFSLKKYIKISDNFYLNSLINNENRISRFINFCKRLFLLNKYLSIDTIIYCKFLNDIRDMSDDMFLYIINLVSNKNQTVCVTSDVNKH